MCFCYKIRSRITKIRDGCPSITCPIFCRWLLFALLLVMVVISFSLQNTLGYVLAFVFLITSTVVGISNCISEYQSLDGYVVPRRPLWPGHNRPPTPSPRTTPYIMTIGGDTEQSFSTTSSDSEGEKSFYSSVNSQIPRKAGTSKSSTATAVLKADTTFIVEKNVKQNEPKDAKVKDQV